MSAELLRRAANLMRERAEAATPGPWRWEDPSTESWPQGDESLVSDGVLWSGERGGGPYPTTVLHGWGYDASGIEGSAADRSHIASWHPAVALAVADWLEREADWTAAGAGNSPEPQAIAVARAYLGEAGQ